MTNPLIPDVKYATLVTEGDGATTNWEINFAGGYISKDHVKAFTEDKVTGQLVIRTTELVGPNTVRIAPAVANGLRLVIYRDTPKTEPIVNYTDGSVMSETNLDKSSQQAVFIAAELADRVVADYDFSNSLLYAVETATEATTVANAIDGKAQLALDHSAAAVVASGNAIAASGAATAAVAALAGAGGSDVVGHVSGTGGTLTTVGNKLREWVSILDVGGNPSGNNNNDNVNALTTLVANGHKFIRLPAKGNKVYYFSGALSADTTAGVTLDVDPGVTISVLDIGYLHPSCRVTRDTDVYLSALLAQYPLSPVVSVKSASRPIWLSYSDREDGKVSPVVCNTELTFRQVTHGKDSFSPFAPAAVTSSAVTVANASSTDYRVGFLKMRPGDAITAWFTDAVGGSPVAMVRTNKSYYALAASTGDTAIPTSLAKAEGGASLGVNIDYMGRGTHASYAAYKSLWTLRLNTSTNFSVLFNGVVVHTVNTDAEIIEGGFGGQGSAGGSIAIKDWTVTSGRKQGGAKPINIATFGDSITDKAFNGSWPAQMAMMLDGHFGLRVNFLQNYAVSGHSSAQQLALCTPSNIASYDVVCIMVGVNDIQGNVPVSTYLSNLSAMISVGLSANKKVVVGIPTMYYSQGQAGTGVGQAAQRYDLGAAYRAGCLRLCAEMGVSVVNTLEHMTPALADWVNPALNPLSNLGHDPVLFDNIHHTQFGSSLKATSFAQVVAGLFMRKPTLETRTAALPSANLTGGWKFTSQGPTWSRDSTGWVLLRGLIDRGTAIVNGTVVYTMPEGIRPLTTYRGIAWCDAGSGFVQIDASTGQVSIYGFPAGGTWLSLDGFTFETR